MDSTLLIPLMTPAILDGRKTQTRYIVKDATLHGFDLAVMLGECSPLDAKHPNDQSYFSLFFPYGNIGDRLFVPEPWRIAGVSGWSMDATQPCMGWIDYQGGGDKEVTAPNFDALQALLPDDWDWDFPEIDYFPAETMPEWMARIWLEITNIRVERLQDISEADAEAEGVPCTELGLSDGLCKAQFADLWESINGADSWAANPWVWVVSFRVVQGGDL